MMIDTISKWKLDIWGLSETNIVWHNINQKHQWKERTRLLSPIQSNFAFNKHESLGGVGIVSTTDLSGRIFEHGMDNLGLGRWVWHKFRGKYGFIVRCICFYRPCTGETQEVEASLRTISQHRRFFNDPTIDPRKKFLEDLSHFISQCQRQNEKIIVMGDLNDDVRKIDTFSSIGLQEVVSSRFQHPLQLTIAPLNFLDRSTEFGHLLTSR